MLKFIRTALNRITQQKQAAQIEIKAKEEAKSARIKDYQQKLVESIKIVDKSKIGQVISDHTKIVNGCTQRETVVMTEFGPLNRIIRQGKEAFSPCVNLANSRFSNNISGTFVCFNGFVPIENNHPVYHDNTIMFVGKAERKLDHFGLDSGCLQRVVQRFGSTLSQDGSQEIYSLYNNEPLFFRTDAEWTEPKYLAPDQIIPPPDDPMFYAQKTVEECIQNSYHEITPATQTVTNHDIHDTLQQT